MTQGPIENPISNSPYTEPQLHFTTSADGDVTGEMEPRGIILARVDEAQNDRLADGAN